MFIKFLIFEIMLMLTSTKGCGPVKADIVFLIDESGSVRPTNFQKQLQFLSNLVDSLTIGENEVRVGAVTFSDSPVFQFSLDAYTNAAELKTAIRSIGYRRGGTEIADGINYVKNTFLTTTNGAREDADDYIFLVTDGYSDGAGTAGQAATASGITMWTVGIGSEVNYFKQELKEIVSPNYHYFFYVENFDSLSRIIPNVTSLFPCPYFCGIWSVSFRDPIALAITGDTTTDMMYLLYDNTYEISCCGVISVWEFFAENSGSIEMVVWRKSGATFEVIGSNEIVVNASDVGNVMKYTVPVDQRIAVVSGDYIGWYCSGLNVIPYKVCNTTEDYQCPQSNLQSSVTSGSLSAGLQFNWLDVFGTTGVLADRAYAVRFHTSNNTAPKLTAVSFNSTLDSSTPVGATILTYTSYDRDVGDVLTYNFTHQYFSLDKNLGVVTLSRPLPLDGSLSPNQIYVTAHDTCYNSATITFSVSVAVLAPKIRNLPHTLSLSEDIPVGTKVYSLNIADELGTGLCCHLNHSLPPTDHFSLENNSTGFPVIVKTKSPLRYARINSYRITFCCDDGTTYIRGVLQVNVKKPITTRPKPPGWLYTSVSISMVPIATAFVTAIALLTQTFFLDTCD